MRESGRSGPTPELEASDLAPGARVGDYVIERTLARGGFGVVHRARHEQTGELRAIKVLHPEVAASPEAVLRLEREADVLRAIAHASVLALYAVGRLSDGRPYLVTELLDGADLETLVRERGRFPAEEVLAMLEPLASALGAAHERGIVHRDLKASNVFLDERGGVRRVVLLDFGVAKLASPSPSSLTSSRRMVGTPACMAPEQIRGRAIDGRADVYALGVLTFQLLTGELPFRGDSFVQAQQLHLYARPPAVSSRAPVEPAFDAVIARAMSKEPAQRQPNAAAFLAELRAASDGAGDAEELQLVAVHVEVFIAGGALDDPDDALLDDHESILPLAAAALCGAGLAVAVETGNTLLAVTGLEGSSAEGAGKRARALAAALEAVRRIDARPGRDPRVSTAIAVHAGPARRIGASFDGSAVDSAAWAPDAPVGGVVATRAALEGLEADVVPHGELEHLLRVRHVAR
jgi:serine/threonine-protein kinase